MNYEIVTLEEKTLVGLSESLSNNDPNMGEKIGKMWDTLFSDKVYEQIKNQNSPYSIGLYSGYDDTNVEARNLSYDLTIGFAVSKNENPEYTQKIIPAGKYARFFIKGDMRIAVSKAWQEIWQTPLPRSFTGDFEEYLNSSMDEAEVAIYIALK